MDTSKSTNFLNTTTLYEYASQAPSFTSELRSNLQNHPEFAKVVGASAVMTLGGGIGAYKFGRKAISSLLDGDFVTGTAAAGASTLCGGICYIGGRSVYTIFSNEPCTWKDYNFDVIKDTFNGTVALVRSYANQTLEEISKYAADTRAYKMGEYVAEQIANDTNKTALTFCATATASAGLGLAAGAIAEKAFQDFNAGNLSKGCGKVALSGALAATSVVSALTALSYFKSLA
jgi:hypothetical protein